MSNVFLIKLKIRKIYQTFLFVLLLFSMCNVNRSFSCDKIAALPNDLEVLLPQYQKLERLHLFNYFFLDDTPESGFKIVLKEKSVFKIQITPYHTDLEVHLKISSNTVVLESGKGIPMDYTSYKSVLPGIIEIKFVPKINDDLTTDFNNRHDQDCDSPYMKLEIYLENDSHLKNRLEILRKSTSQLIEFDLNFDNVFKQVSDMIDTDAHDPNTIPKKYKTELNSYKLKLPEKGLVFYDPFNITVISEFDVIVPDDEIRSNSNITKIHHIKKYLLKMQIFSDFFLSGGYYLLLIKSNELENLNNFQCLYDGSCMISDRPEKNAILLQSIITPGSYKLLLIDIDTNYNKNMNVPSKDKIPLRKALKLDYIPITSKIKVKLFHKSQNQYNCNGRPLPSYFDYLNNAKEKYFEFKGDIIMNIDRLYDDVSFQVEEDSILRVITFYGEGNHITIELDEIVPSPANANNPESKVEFNKLITQHGGFSNIVSDVFKDTGKSFVTLSDNTGGGNGLLYPVKSGKRYKLTFNYSSTFFNEEERKSCEMFYLKIAISKNELIKQNIPPSTICNSIDRNEDLTNFIDMIEKNHETVEEYTFTIEKPILVPMRVGQVNSILYSKEFEIRKSVNINIEVISDFVSSYIVPVIIPAKEGNISDILNHKYKKFIFHENNIKVKLNKGKYTLLLVNGISQANSGKEGTLFPYEMIDLIKCMSFKLRVNIIRLNSNKLLNWECNYKHYDVIPDNLFLYYENREKIVYSSMNLLLPFVNRKLPFRNMKLFTGNQGYFLKLVAEYKDLKTSKQILQINLKNDKINKLIRKAKNYIVDHDTTSDQIYLNFYLRPNMNYLLNFEVMQIEGWSFYEYCRTFKLEMVLIREDILNKKSNSECVENTPLLDQVIFERMMDTDNSFFKYGSRTPLQLFGLPGLSSGDTSDSSAANLEVNHSQGFTFRFTPDVESKKKEFLFNFEVKSFISKATILIENSSPVGISAKIRSLTESGGYHLVASEDLEDGGVNSIRNLLLEIGKYQIIFYANTPSDKYFNEYLKNQCISFQATVLLENRSFNIISRNVEGSSETCPFLSFPSNLNIPGWLYADTDYTINSYYNFKLKSNSRVNRFTIRERSIFKFHIPNNENNNNLYSLISLHKIKSNNVQKLVERLQNGNTNFINIILEKGTYQLEFFLHDDSDFKDNCRYLNIYLALLPISTVKDNIDSFNSSNCYEKMLTSDNALKPNSYLKYIQMRLLNTQDNDKLTAVGGINSNSNTISNVRKFRLMPANSSGKFVAELIFNNYIDVLYSFLVFQVDSGMDNYESMNMQSIKKLVPFELIKIDNISWLTFHFDKGIEYLIEIDSSNFSNYSLCSDVYFSYNYQEYADQNNSESSSDSEEEYLTKKDTCSIEDSLPNSFSNNHENILDRYGGSQSPENGEINFLGEFLLPKTTTNIRSEFIIKQKSVIFVKIIPKYTHSGTSNIFMEIHREKNMLYRFARNEFNGVMIAQLDNLTSYDSSPTTQSVFYLDINFDQTQMNCETFEFILSIIPTSTYIDEYLSCNVGTRDNLPEKLLFDKTSQYYYNSYLKLDDNNFKSEDGNFYRVIELEFIKATSLTIVLEYIVSDNYMDIIIEKMPDANSKSSINYNFGDESFHISPSVNGIVSKKEITVNLKKGKYQVKVIYHKFFTDLLKKIFDKESSHFCFGFNLELEGILLNTLKENNTNANQNNLNDDESDDDVELNHLSKSSFGSLLNVITAIDPPELHDIKLNVKFDIEIRFAYDVTNDSFNNSRFKSFVYLRDISDTNGRKIFPERLQEIQSNKIKYVFKTSSQVFEPKKCYRLYIEDQFKSEFDSEGIDNINHAFCTIKCDCLSTSSFKCSEGGKCICHFPYTGNRCESCAQGFKLNKFSKCVDEKASSNLCTEKLTCMSHGICVRKEFDAYTVAHENPDGACKCDENYTTAPSPNGFPIQTFCNVCTNPSRTFPYCDEKEGDNSDFLQNTMDSNCKNKDELITLPLRFFNTADNVDSSLDLFDGGQDVDGSFDLLSVFFVRYLEELTEIIIPEDSIIRIFYDSREVNRAKILLLDDKYDEDPIAFTEGIEKNESFIAKLTPKTVPYYIKIMHSNMKFGCNRYRLKIVIRPLKNVFSNLICKNKHVDNPREMLPPELVKIENTALILGENKKYAIADSLMIDFNSFKKSADLDSKTTEYLKIYNNSGVLTRSYVDEEFIYNIRLEIKYPIAFSASVIFDFVESDLSLVLRDKEGKVLKSGENLIPDSNVHTSDEDFINNVNMILDPDVYYLSLTQGLSTNHLLQIVYDTQSKLIKKSNLRHCFSFNFHIQTSPINKPDASLSTAKFESMYNRIVNVEPESSPNINVNKKFEIFVTFEDSISSSVKSTETGVKKSSFKEAFYLQNTRTGQHLPATHVYLQGGLSKTFLIIYDENVLIKDECYELKYNMDILLSSEDRDRKVTSDLPLIHRYCTKSCNCNPHTAFSCDENTNKCICEEPYTGEGCFSCIEKYVYARGKCISFKNCKKNFCSGFGSCRVENAFDIPDVNLKMNRLPTCMCDEGYTGANCSECKNESETFPDCVTLDVDSKTGSSPADLNKFLNLDVDEVTELDKEQNKCPHIFLPDNLDTLGYLHLDGNMHISGKYSLKHINNKHYSMVFTIKEKSHVKIYIEHSKTTHMIILYLFDNTQRLLQTSSTHIGPSGYGSSSLIDFIIDPIKDSNYNFANYVVRFYIKDINTEDSIDSTAYDESGENITNECFTVFMEMQVLTTAKELNIINSDQICARKQEKLPVLSQLLGVDNLDRYIHIRSTNSVYFFYEYFYAADHLDQELVLDIQVNSKFINSHVGVLLEIVEIPLKINETLNRTTLSSKMIASLIEGEGGNGLNLQSPECKIHCFSGIKKFNSVYLSRELPSDTYFRIWLYDVSPVPMYHVQNNNEINSTCVEFEVKMDTRYVQTKDIHRSFTALCHTAVLPTNLNIKGFLGDSKYLEKWGFHILDDFRIDHAVNNTGLTHETFFELKEHCLLRLVVFQGRVDTDLDLFIKNSDKSEYILIARSGSKNFEDVIVIELPPGNYKLQFKFFPPSTGFHKCESIKMEFSINSFNLLQSNIDRMVARHKNNPKFTQIDFAERIKKNNGKDIFEKDTSSIKYVVELNPPFIINKDDPKVYEPSLFISKFTFVIEAEDNNKIEFITYINSDFLYLDANIYLSVLPVGNSDSKNAANAKIIPGRHKKNMNLLVSGPLESGTYVVTLRYYRRLHYKLPWNKSYDDVGLFRATFAEVEFDAMLVNKSNDEISILTSSGYMKLPAFKSNQSSISHNWLCRHSALPIPKSLSSLRYFEFNSDVHILDHFLIPAMGEGEEVIKFRLKFTPNLMIRVYVECHDVNIDLELREKTSFNEFKVIAESKTNMHFETVTQIINDEKEYEIVLKFGGDVDAVKDRSSNCQTFKMEIAMEKAHNYACPDNNKYSLLTDLKAVPEVVPVKISSEVKTHSNAYRYDSRNFYLGEDKNSGYVYLLRKPDDQTIEYTKFDVQEDVDFKIEVLNDFMQAPITILLTQHGNEPSDLAKSKIFNTLRLKDAFIFAYGEIFENRSTLLVRNLPRGSYTLYFYLPGLATKFIHESRVCSIYDLIVEIKRSRLHFQGKEIINKAEITNEGLDIPEKIPVTLNSLQFLDQEETYINYSNEYYLRKNSTVLNSTNIELYNSFSFTLNEESIVEFSVEHDKLGEIIQVAIDGFSHYSRYTNAVLKPGKYNAIIKVDSKLKKGRTGLATFTIDSLESLINFYVGISPLKRVSEIYTYNNLQSAYHQCKSKQLPQTFFYDEETHLYSYNEELFTFNREELNNLRISHSSVVLSKSDSYRIIAQIGGDYVLNKLSLVVKTEHKSYKTNWNSNHGALDITVPAGTYQFQLEIDERIIAANLECIIFSIKILIVDVNFLSMYDTSHPMYMHHTFNSETHSKSNLLQQKCDGSILPLELHRQAETTYHRIRENGDYFLHLEKALYFNSKQNSKNAENINEIDINLEYESIVRIRTFVSFPKEYQIIPKMKIHSKARVGVNDEGNPDNLDSYLQTELQFISHDLKERNIIWFLEKNTHPSDEFYILELVQEKYEDLTESSPNYNCPYYGLDVLIQSVSEIVNRMECIKEGSDRVLEYLIPNRAIPEFKINDSKPYHEKIEFSYFTEKQYGRLYVNDDSFKGMQYIIDLNISDEGEYHISIELGYDQIVSLFDIFLSKVEDNDQAYSSRVVALSDEYFDKANQTLPYKRVLNAKLTKGKYVIMIVEDIWSDINNKVKAHTGRNESTKLCLPFSYNLDIIPANDKTSAPEIISVFPPGPIAFKSIEEDLNIKVILSKPPFTKKHEPITYVQNIMNIINAFYLVKIPTRSDAGLAAVNNNADSDINNGRNNSTIKIHPSKLEGSENNKEWNLLFLKDHFEPNFDYKLKLDSNWIYDVNYTPFRVTKKLPIIRVETNRQTIFDFVDNIKNMKNKMNGADLKQETDEPKDKDLPRDQGVTSDLTSTTKCGEHGRLILDNILKKYICTCIHGFSGKYCDICLGYFDKILNKCVSRSDDEDADDDSNEPTSEPISAHIPINTDNTSKSSTDRYGLPPAQSDFISCDGGCVNGFCDSKTGKCVCDMEYTGPRCDKHKPKTESSSSSTYSNQKQFDSLSSILTNALIHFV